MPEKASVGDAVLAKLIEFTRRIRLVVEQNIVGVGSKPTLLVTMPEKASVGDGIPLRIFPHPDPLPQGRGEKRRRPRRPVVEKNIIGVGSKPTLFLTMPERASVEDVISYVPC